MQKHTQQSWKCECIVMSLSKALGTINHNPLIAAITVYGLSYSALTSMLDGLKGRPERVSVYSIFSTWEEIIASVPQDSIMGPLFLYIFLNDVFFFKSISFLSNYNAFGSDLNNPKTKSRPVKII